MKMIKTLLLFALAACTTAVLANPDVVKAELLKKYPEVKADKVTKAGYSDLYEIYSNGEIIYTDEKVTFLLLGTLVDASTRANVSDARLQKLSAIAFNELPFEHAIKLVRGKGTRKMAIFEDPNCGYCKKFEQDINALEDVTAYIFAYPILAQDSVDKSKQIWCSPDRLKAWQDQMLRQKAPTAAATCNNPIDKIVALGQKLHISGTPMTYFEDGERISGAMDRARIEARLASAKAAPLVEAKK